MKLLLLIVLMTQIGHGENLSQNELQLIQSIRAQGEAKQREQDFEMPVSVSVEKGRAIEGPASAPVTVVTFSDFQCPYCSKGAETAKELRKKYGGKVRFIFKHFPLDFHPYAMAAAKRFEAIADQSAKLAYKYHDELFANQTRIQQEGEKYLDEAAKKVGADLIKMRKQMESEKVRDRIQLDKAEGAKLGVSGTPAFVVAGVRFFGAYPASEMIPYIEKRLKK